MHFTLPDFPRLLACTMVLVAFVASATAETVSREYMLKAAFIYNFLKFVEWPQDDSGEAKDPLVIGVLGENPFGDELEKVVDQRTVKGRPIRVRLGVTGMTLKGVDLLFVPVGAEAGFARLKGGVGQGILTVGESEAFAAKGGMIVFCVHDERLCFEVNGKKAAEAGLKVSAQLMKLSR